jgi:hypothetical protein
VDVSITADPRRLINVDLNLLARLSHFGHFFLLKRANERAYKKKGIGLWLCCYSLILLFSSRRPFIGLLILIGICHVEFITEMTAEVAHNRHLINGHAAWQWEEMFLVQHIQQECCLSSLTAPFMDIFHFALIRMSE